MKLKKNAQQKCRGILEEIDDEGESLSRWEIEFVESLTKLVESSPAFYFTKPQMVKLQNIHDRRVP